MALGPISGVNNWMIAMTTFAEIVDATDRLTLDERQELLEVLKQRIRDENRRRLRAEADASLADYAAGEYEVLTPKEIMDEARRGA